MRLFVGLTGGIGSGKSAVANQLEVNGAVIIDSDLLAREVVEPGTDGLAAIVDAFGADVLDVDGGLNRPALGRLVFDDPARRRQLEAIIHPLVRARSAEIAQEAPDDAIVVNDVPLLIEAGLEKSYDLVIVVLADEATRLQRIIGARGVSEADGRARIAAQATDEQRRAVADIVIDNNDTLAALNAKVDALWQERFAPPAGPVEDEDQLETDLEHVTDTRA